MRILIAWELGDNYGHLLRLLPVALELRQRHHDVFFAVKNTHIAQYMIAPHGFPFVQAPLPISPRPAPLNREMVTYGDILVMHGFADEHIIEPLLQSWQHLYRLYQPDVVVLDHAPAALCAARMIGIPTARIEMGFSLPPESFPFPRYKKTAAVSDAVLRQAEERIHSTLQRLCEAHRCALAADPTALLQADASLLATFEELDHYPKRAAGNYLGPIFTVDQGEQAQWPHRSKANLFVYLRPNPALPAILDVLARTDANIICAIPGIDASLRARYQTNTLQIHTSALHLETLLEQCDIAIASAGNGLLSACLLRGIPSLLVPTQPEQTLIGERVMHLGAGLSVPLTQVVTGFAAALARLLREPQFRERAQGFAQKYRSYDMHATVLRIVNVIEGLSGERPRSPPATQGTEQPPIRQPAQKPGTAPAFIRRTHLGTPRIALVTGGSRGIGAAIAKRLAEDGLTILVNYRQNRDAAEKTVQDIQARGGAAYPMQADLSDSVQLRELFSDIRHRFGQLDVLVNNAGMAQLAPLESLDSALIQNMLSTNITAVLCACQEAAPLFPKNGGNIINISSILSHGGPAGASLYSATKAGVEGLTRTLATELGQRGVTVNAVSPGQIDTDLYRGLSNPRFNEYVLSRTPLRRLGRPNDIAEAVAFFASPNANWITGQVLRVDGGFNY